jgi:microcystin-dependent protein
MRISVLISIATASLFLLCVGGGAFAAPVVVIPGEGAGYIYYSEGSASAAAAPVEDDSNVGMVAAFFFTPPTETWVVCEGQTISSAQYPKLVKALTGSDAATSATMPDLRGYFLRGANTEPTGIDQGRVVGSVQGDAIRNITGQAQASSTRGLTTGSVSGAFTKGTYTSSGVETASDYPTRYGLKFDASLVVPTADENRPHNIAVIYAMRAK